MSLMKESSIPELPLISRGKVRDLYDLGDALLLISTDRVSAFDVVFNELIPDKGAILNSISAFWFEKLAPVLPNHVLSTQPADYPQFLQKYSKDLEKRSMIVKKARMLPVECIVRAYLEGSALKSYQQDGCINGVKMPDGLVQGDRLPQLIFTPSTKEECGHDRNISVEELAELLGKEMAESLEKASLDLFKAASAHAEKCGIILADSKMEFGLVGDDLMLCDEAFTPDSSRFWAKDSWQPGHAQKSFDKQFLREWLETLDWDKTPPAPALPKDIIDKTAARYREAWQRLTGRVWED